MPFRERAAKPAKQAHDPRYDVERPPETSGNAAHATFSAPDDRPARTVKKAGPATGKSIWMECWKEAFSDDPLAPPNLAPSKEDCGRLKAMLASMGEGGMRRYLSWTFSEWHDIVERRLKWMTERRPPAFPTPGFVCGLVRVLAGYMAGAAYEDRRIDRKIAEREAAARPVQPPKALYRTPEEVEEIRVARIAAERARIDAYIESLPD